MKNNLFNSLIAAITLVIASCNSHSSKNKIELEDIVWNTSSPASMRELTIPSDTSDLQGFVYKANGLEKHPTLILLHGYPGSEKNLDLAQVVRSRGWNVIYFNYRGSWGSKGQFSFTNCVDDVINVVAYCKRYSDSLQIDTANIVLFGHSLGAWICLKALQELPDIKKGFAVSTWNIYEDFKDIKDTEQAVQLGKKRAGEYFILNTSVNKIFGAVLKNINYYSLVNHMETLAYKQIIMIDEHSNNKKLADTLKSINKSYFYYEVWNTDHPFTNKRISLINTVITFLNK